MEALEKESSPRHKLACRENLYLYHIVLPDMFACAMELFGLNESQTRQAIGGEYYSKFPEYMSYNPIRPEGHPFPKTFKSTAAIYDSWVTKRTKGFPINQAYPDLVIQDPAPTSIVFDGKYFTGGNAIDALVSGAYEIFYYRGLLRNRLHAYDYGCLLAFDASPDQTLVSAWDAVVDKHLFYNSHVFPLVVGVLD